MLFLRDHLPDIVQILQNGGIVCAPTDTIWGLHCDATQPDAIEKIAKIKGRSPEKGYVLLVSSLEMLKKHVPYIPPRLETLLAYHARPLTMIYENAEGLAPAAFAPDGSVGIRIVQDEFIRQIVEGLGRPVVSTSANVSGEPFPTGFGSISSDILQACDYITRHRQRESDPVATPSSVARLDENNELDFIRE